MVGMVGMVVARKVAIYTVPIQTAPIQPNHPNNTMYYMYCVGIALTK